MISHDDQRLDYIRNNWFFQVRQCISSLDKVTVKWKSNEARENIFFEEMNAPRFKSLICIPNMEEIL